MVILGGGISRTAPFAVSLTVTEGTLYKIATNQLTTTTAVTDTPYAVATEDDLDSEGTARTTVSGDRLNVALIGSSEIVMVKSLTGQTWANSAVCIGHYVGAGETTSGVTKVKVLLDTAMAS